MINPCGGDGGLFDTSSCSIVSILLFAIDGCRREPSCCLALMPVRALITSLLFVVDDDDDIIVIAKMIVPPKATVADITAHIIPMDELLTLLFRFVRRLNGAVIVGAPCCFIC